MEKTEPERGNNNIIINQYCHHYQTLIFIKIFLQSCKSNISSLVKPTNTKCFSIFSKLNPPYLTGPDITKPDQTGLGGFLTIITVRHLSVCLIQCAPLSLVEIQRGSALIGRELHSGATPALLCHKEPAPRIQSSLLGAFCLLLAGSLWHKDSWLPCTERSYYRRPYAIKNQRGASKKPLVGGFGCEELVLYGIRDTIITPRKSPPHRDGPHCLPKF